MSVKEEKYDFDNIQKIIQNYLTKSEIKYENTNLLSELIKKFIENKVCKEEKMLKLKEERNNINYLSSVT